MDSIQNNSHRKHTILCNLDDIKKMNAIAKALASDIRLEILQLLVKRAMTMTDLSRALFVSMSSVSMHTKILSDAGLISIVPKPGTHGVQKLCGIRIDQIDFALHLGEVKKQPQIKTLNIPIGSYSEANVVAPCGLLSNERVIETEDSVYAFYSPEHYEAQRLWFTSGFVKYRITNEHFCREDLRSVNISLEICSEAPGYNNTWPSDIYLEINDIRVATLHVQGDYGGTRGLLTPSWWPESCTQYGELRSVTLTDSKVLVDGKAVNALSFADLHLNQSTFFTLALGVDPNSENVGGINLFGRGCGNYAQDIRLEICYDN